MQQFLTEKYRLPAELCRKIFEFYLSSSIFHCWKPRLFTLLFIPFCISSLILLIFFRTVVGITLKGVLYFAWAMITTWDVLVDSVSVENNQPNSGRSFRTGRPATPRTTSYFLNPPIIKSFPLTLLHSKFNTQREKKQVIYQQTFRSSQEFFSALK